MKAIQQPRSGRWALKAYRPFVSAIREHIRSASQADPASYKALLDGAASRELKSGVGLARRKRLGAFFTGSDLATRAAGQVHWDFETITDPACGAGDLLLAAARKLPVRSTAGATLAHWGSRLAGFDLVPEFVQVTRLRLALLACERTGDFVEPRNLDALLPEIRRVDGFAALRDEPVRGLLFLNPPFSQIPVPRGAGWRINKMTKAATFLEAGITAMAPGASLIAILPDVIRSGSGYSPLRQWIEENLRNVTITMEGRFDPSTDVDVFVLTGQKREVAVPGANAVDWYQTGSVGKDFPQSVGNFFDIHVGKLVEYRDENKGTDRAFLTAGDIVPGSVMYRIPGRWGAGSQVTIPPFVAIRRTSSPSEKRRALAAVVAGNRPVAVENHLITARPHSGKLSDAKKLMQWLASDRVNSLLQQRIRCRHLTLASIKELPWV